MNPTSPDHATTEPKRPDLGGKAAQLCIITVAELLALALWFSASAVVPQLTVEWSLSPAAAGWMTAAVQLGFVAGALASALTNLPDRIDPRWLIALSALTAAGLNALFTTIDGSVGAAIALRFATGAVLAGAYPPSMKLVATWCREDRGFGIGLVVGAVTLGSALPHLVNALPLFGEGGMPAWRPTVLVSSAMDR